MLELLVTKSRNPNTIWLSLLQNSVTKRNSSSSQQLQQSKQLKKQNYPKKEQYEKPDFLMLETKAKETPLTTQFQLITI